MKKFVVAGLVLGLGSLATVAFAHAPVITINPIPDLTYATFPQTYDVTGMATHNPINVVQNLALHVNNVVVSSSSAPFALLSGTTSPYTLPWNITGPGTYTVFVTARHGVGGQTGTSTEESVAVAQTIVVTQCPAAPAIAGVYMRDVLGIKPTSAVFKNVIQTVARQTGNSGLLWAERACDIGYANAVRDFVDGL
jgi:hypothetical protein